MYWPLSGFTVWRRLVDECNTTAAIYCVRVWRQRQKQKKIKEEINMTMMMIII